VIRRPLNIHIKEDDVEQQMENIFHTRCHINNKVCSMIINRGICANVASTIFVKKLNFNTFKHEKPYRFQWLNDCGEVRVNKQILVSFLVREYNDEVLCGIVSMHAIYLLLGIP